jgi:outer membrane protein assembly factor BamB
MAISGLRRVQQALSQALGLLALAVLAAQLQSCGRGDMGLSTGAVPISGPVRITAHWLRDQPGVDLGEFAFRLLNAAGEPVELWRGVEILQPQAGSASFELRIKRGAPDDLYLYVAYPGDRFRFDAAYLSADRSSDYLFLAVPRCLPDVVALGASRIGALRDQAAPAGPLANISFSIGREQPVRQASAVNEDLHSAPVLALSSAAGGGLQLDWDERNIGDYDNNSQVGIADVTPVGIRYGQQLAGSAVYQELLLIDGDENGIIGIGDLTPIGRNFARFTQGFSVYHTLVDNPQPGDFTALSKPTVLRQTVWDAATPEQRKCRLHYSYVHAAFDGANSYYVRAYSNDGGVESEGPASNIVSRSVSSNNKPPTWLITAGLISAAGVGDGIGLLFDGASDPELDTLTYSIAYILSPGAPGDPGTASIDLPSTVTDGAPPYTYHIGGLTPGAEYQLTVQVRDIYHDPIAGNVLSARVPLSSDPDPWPQQRSDNARTGCRADTVLTAPLLPAWETPLDGAALAGTTLVVSHAGWAGVFVDTGEFKRYDVATGVLLATHPAPPPPAAITAGADPVLQGDRLIVGVSNGLAVYDLATTDPPVVYPGPGAVAVAPVLDNGVAYTADLSGVVRAVNAETGALAWSAAPSTGATYHISPCSDADNMYVLADSGALAKLRLADGAVLKTGMLPAAPSGDALALDAQAGKLYIGTAEDRLVEVSAADLSVLHRFPLQASEVQPTAPCLVLQANPRLAVLGVSLSSMLETPGKVIAINLDTASVQWEDVTDLLSFPQHITASSDLIVACCSMGDYLYDHQGRLRQSFDMNSGYLVGDVAVLEDRAVGFHGNYIYSRVSQVPSNPPVWDDTVGIKRCTRTVDSMTVNWDGAGDDEGQPVYYAIYYSEVPPPQFDAPYTGTTLITDLADETEVSGKAYHSYTIHGLDPGKDYYAGVRAYDAPWDSAPQIDQNTNWLKASPQWQREELVLGDDLPAGEVFFMRGLVNPSGEMHLAYNDTNTGAMTHVFGTTGAWQHDGAGLAAQPAITGFEPAWDAANSRLALAYAGADSIGIIKRTGLDTWDVEDWSPSYPVTNPQVSLAFGPGPALAYTRFITGEFPVITEYYYMRREVGGTLQDFEILDNQNYCGRDLDVVFAPSAGADLPWVAMQRGIEAVPGRLTPEKGELVFAQALTGGGFELQTIDAGVNAPDSDSGKRVQQVLDAGDNPHLAYLDLNASGTETMGQLKYAVRSGGTWQIETVDSFSLRFQTGQLQYTYGELGLGLTGDGRAVIAMLFRTSVASDVTSPHSAEVRVWVRGLDGVWALQRVTDPESVFLRDREPCVLLVTPDGNWHVFYASYHDPLDVKADKIVHLWSTGQ